MNELLPVAPDVEPMATTPDGFDLSQLHADNQEQEQETAYNFNRVDLMLRSIVRENRKPSFAELTFLKGRCGWSDIEINNQTRRMKETLRFLSIIGTAAQREAIDDENEKAREVLETEKPKLLKKLAAIQEQINDLDRSATSAERRVEQVDAAMAELAKPELLRDDLLAKYHALLQHFGATTGQEMGELGVEIQHYENLLNPPDGEIAKRFWLENWHRFDCESCSRQDVPGGGKSLRFSEPAFTNRKRDMAGELVEMRRTFEQLETVKAEHSAKLADIAHHYIKENG